MANDPTPGSRPFPTAREGASDDDIFAEMSRMLAHDQFSRPAAAGERPQKPPSAEEAPDEDPPLELTEVVAPRHPPQQAAATEPAASATAPQSADTPPLPRETTVSAAVAMLDRQPDAAPIESGITVSTRSLDDLVEDLLRPMLQEWLDQNLERIVREHVAGLPNETPPQTPS